MAKWNKIGEIRQKKSGEGVTVIVLEDVSLKKGSYLQVQDPRKSPYMLKNPEKAANIPAWVKYELVQVVEE